MQTQNVIHRAQPMVYSWMIKKLKLLASAYEGLKLTFIHHNHEKILRAQRPPEPKPVMLPNRGTTKTKYQRAKRIFFFLRQEKELGEQNFDSLQA